MVILLVISPLLHKYLLSPKPVELPDASNVPLINPVKQFIAILSVISAFVIFVGNSPTEIVALAVSLQASVTVTEYVPGVAISIFLTSFSPVLHEIDLTSG